MQTKSLIVATTIGIVVLAWSVKNLFFITDFNQDFGHPPSWPIFLFNAGLSMALHSLADRIMPPQYKVLNDATGYSKFQIMYATIRLDIPELLSTGPKSTEELAQLSGVVNTDNLLRLLRASESFGYFSQDLKTGKWSHSLYSSILQENHHNSMSALIRHWKEDTGAAWDMTYEAIHDDTLVFEYTHDGLDMWSYFSQHPKQEAQFAVAMHNVDSSSWHAQVHDYNWGQYKRIVDVGGSLGSLLSRVLSYYPSLSGVVFDRPFVIQEAKKVWKEQHAAIAPRMTFASGSFFDIDSFPILKDGDAVSIDM